MEKKVTSDDLTHMWLDEKLQQSDIETKLRGFVAYQRYIYPRGLPEEVITQVGMCIHHIYEHYHDWRGPHSFLRALATDNFSQIMDHADNMNLQGIYLYRLYLKNCAPMDWKQKLRGE